MGKKEKFECPDCGAVIENDGECRELACECGAVLISEEQEIAEQLLAESLSRKWYYSRDEKRYGPIPWNRVKKFIGEQKLGADDLIWSRGMESWARVRSFPELLDCFPEEQRPELMEPEGMPSDNISVSEPETSERKDIGCPGTFVIRVCAGLLAAIGFFQIFGIAAVIYAVYRHGVPLHHATWLVSVLIAGAVIFTGTAQLIRMLCHSSQRICEISDNLKKLTEAAGENG